MLPQRFQIKHFLIPCYITHALNTKTQSVHFSTWESVGCSWGCLSTEVPSISVILWVSDRTQIILLRFEGKGQFVLEARPVWHSVHSNVRSHPLCRWVSWLRWGEEGNKVCYMSRARKTLNEIWDCAKENSFIPGKCRGGNLDAKDQFEQNLKCSWQINSIKQLVIYLQCLYQLQFPCFGVCLCLYRRVQCLCKWPQDSLMMESEFHSLLIPLIAWDDFSAIWISWN